MLSFLRIFLYFLGIFIYFCDILLAQPAAITWFDLLLISSYDLKKNKKKCLTCNLAATESKKIFRNHMLYTYNLAIYILA